MLKFIAKIFGTKSEKDIRKLMPLVEETNREWEKLKGISNDALREKTFALKARIAEHLKDIDGQLAEHHARIAAEPDLDLGEKERIFGEIDKLGQERNVKLEKVLLEILPQAFAIVWETARRFRENEYLEVTARDYDRILAARAEHIAVEGNNARWKNQWVAAGNLIKWDMVHYDVQIIGGIVLHEGDRKSTRLNSSHT